MSVEIVSGPARVHLKVKLPAHWVDFLHEEASRWNAESGEFADEGTVVLHVIKRLARERGWVCLGSNNGGVVVREEGGDGE